MLNDEIHVLKNRFVEQLSPLKVYLFGSYAYGIPDKDSDYDFYIVVDDSRADSYEQTVLAYRAIRHARTRPVDIVVGTNSAFETQIKENQHSIENEVFRKGILLYGAKKAIEAAEAIYNWVNTLIP